MHPLTQKIYQQDVYARSCPATVLEVSASQDVLLDRTVFFPEGGGQSSDRGSLVTSDERVFTIDHVHEEGGYVWHSLRLSVDPDTPCSTPAGSTDLSLRPGDTVTAAIDWEHRFDNMQRHLGEHLLSGRLAALWGGVNRGFHMGADYMTIDVDFEGQAVTPGTMAKVAAAEKIDQTTVWNWALQAEAATNQIIWQDLPVTVTYCTDPEEAAALPLRKPLSSALEDLASDPATSDVISVVTVGDPADPADCCACCGTHPSSTGQVGLLKIYKIEKNKGMWRIYFEAGRPAMARYDRVFDIASQLARQHSTEIEQLPDRAAKEALRQKSLSQELRVLRQERGDRLVETILAQLTTHRQLSPGSRLLVFCTPPGWADETWAESAPLFLQASLEEISALTKKLQPQITGTLLLAFPQDRTLWLLSDGQEDCAHLVRTKALPLGAKGGGNTTGARCAWEEQAAFDAGVSALMD